MARTPTNLRLPGTYALALQTSRKANVRVGALGDLQVLPGIYIYTGSALGSGGLAARLRHHVDSAAHPRWHIDYLRRVTALRGAWVARSPDRLEHQWAAVLVRHPQAETPLEGFGSSDCTCRAHLFHFNHLPKTSLIAREFEDVSSGTEVFWVTVSALWCDPIWDGARPQAL